ncbi:hypothetical protein M0C34_04160 [Agarivorans sp. TSD2052]|uniref:hypothetical protein n=1 Tax=Agarivorans sp. TSD2052 TaxID=2937286 RepID=UPI00200F1379|nr:hypothetical protein [Agarivorans sp. TSD2052]UPW19481.1 hypothetical protein M0C34_04160 [Agarivorans sp. TSD2052]
MTVFWIVVFKDSAIALFFALSSMLNLWFYAAFCYCRALSIFGRNKQWAMLSTIAAFIPFTAWLALLALLLIPAKEA